MAIGAHLARIANTQSPINNQPINNRQSAKSSICNRQSSLTIASASISTSISGSISRLTSTIEVVGPDRREDLAVRSADGFPVAGDVGHVDSRAHDILERSAGAFERRADVRKRLQRLRAGVVLADERTIRSRGGRTGDVNHRPNTHGARVPHHRFPLGSGRNVLSGHAFTIRSRRPAARSLCTSGLQLSDRSRSTPNGSENRGLYTAGQEVRRLAGLVRLHPALSIGSHLALGVGGWELNSVRQSSTSHLPAAARDRRTPPASDCAWR
jgi:hypothetical protein